MCLTLSKPVVLLSRFIKYKTNIPTKYCQQLPFTVCRAIDRDQYQQSSNIKQQIKLNYVRRDQGSKISLMRRDALPHV